MQQSLKIYFLILPTFLQALNEVAEQQNIPFEFTDGFIEKMSVSVPWSSILTDASNIQVEGLSLTIKKTKRDITSN